MAFSATPSTLEPREFSIDGMRAELHTYNALGGDTSGTINASRLTRIQHIIFGSGNLRESSAASLSGASATIAFAVPAGTAATLVVQDLTYTAANVNVDGNSITVAYVAGGTAGSEVVTVTGNAISVSMDTGVSTATQIKAAIDASAAALALATVAITGTGSNAQVAAVAAALTGGVIGGARGSLLLLGK